MASGAWLIAAGGWRGPKGPVQTFALLSNGGRQGVPLGLGLPQDQAAHPTTQADPPIHPPRPPLPPTPTPTPTP